MLLVMTKSGLSGTHRRSGTPIGVVVPFAIEVIVNPNAIIGPSGKVARSCGRSGTRGGAAGAEGSPDPDALRSFCGDTLLSRISSCRRDTFVVTLRLAAGVGRGERSAGNGTTRGLHVNDTQADFANRLLSAADGDADLARQLVSLFLEELPGLRANAEGAAAAGDLAGLQRTTHMIKGCAGTLGFMQLAESARMIEEGIRAGTAVGNTPGDITALCLASENAECAARAYLAGTNENPRR
jgi:HPt (histidine-containing phosphotransfer) domain-containing protein